MLNKGNNTITPTIMTIIIVMVIIIIPVMQGDVL